MKKRFLILSGLIISIIVVLFATSVYATSNETLSLTIVSNNLELENAVFMNFKVEANNVDDKAISLLVWESAPEAYTSDSAEMKLSAIRKESDTGYIVFQYDDLAAKDMTKFVYVCAYAEVDGVEIYSNPVKFSIVQYAYNMLNSDNVPEYLEGILTNMLEYGAFSQLYFNHNTDFLATDEIAKIKVVNGTHADGFKTGYYKAGTSVTLTANEAEEGYVFSHWTNSAGEEVGTETTLTIPECVTETYTAVYEEAVKYSEGLAFTSNGDGTCYVSGIGSCTDTEINIPTVSPEGDRVVKIGYRCFYNCLKLASVTIPDSVTIIEYEAFGRCGGLKKVVVGNSVISIGDYAFQDCNGIEDLTIGNSVNSIGQYAFKGCSSIKSVELPNSVTFISYGAFQNCIGLKNVSLGNGVTQIDPYAFYGCSDLTGVYITDISKWCEIDFGDYTANPLYYAKNLYLNGELVIDLIIPDGVMQISKHSFSGCTSITNVEIANSVVKIGESAFSGCSKIESIVIPVIGATVESSNGMVQYPFGYIFGSARYEGGVETVQYYYTIGRNDVVTGRTYYIPEKLTSVTITNANIPYLAFHRCSTITNVTIKDNVTNIEQQAFKECGNLSNVIIGSVTSIGDLAFQSCRNLVNVSISDEVLKIGSSVFNDCGNLGDKIDGVYYVDNCVVGFDNSLSNVILKDGTRLISDTAFYNCKKVVSITIPDSVTIIGGGAFGACSNLKSVNYEGTQQEWEKISIGGNNSYLTNATINYNYIAE